MATRTKKLIIQTSIIVIVLVFCWILGYWVNYYDYSTLWLYSSVAMFFFAPILVLYFIRMKKKASPGRLGVIFDIVAWISVIFFMWHFLYGVWDMFYIPYPEISVLKNIWFSIQLYFYPPYWVDLEYGLLDDLQELSSYSPYLVISALLYWAIRINKQLNK